MKQRQLSQKEISSFQSDIYRYYTEQGRDLPWRNTNDPYCILVSEMMLQQTQVERVMDKYGLFLSKFPDLACLAKATLREVLGVWQGLGYNRRAKFLMALARVVATQHHGKLPSNREVLLKLPGIGRATAGSILAFAFHEPSAFIETNIRRVFIHHFFQDREGIHDDEIIPLVESTLDRSNPRDWYYALMDYGSILKKQTTNPNRKSAHYTRQSPFEDSDRKIRGAILKTLVEKKSMAEEDMTAVLGSEQERMKNILSALVKEGFIVRRGKTYRIA